jgi:iron complex outermembrane receptor protein
MKNNIQFYVFLLVFGVLKIGCLQAQVQQTVVDTVLAGDDIREVTVTAFRLPYNLFNTPAPIDLITPQQLESGSAFTPVEALNQVPGVLMHHGTLNTNRLTIRGIGSRTPYASNKIKAYFGEIPLTTGDGETTLEDLENTSIQRVEIIKGSSSSLYGAGLAGVILFHPKTVLKSFVQNQSTLASFGTFKNTLSAGIGEGKNRIYALGAVLSSDGFRENNSTKRGNLLLNFMHTINEQSNLQLLLKATKMKAYIPSSLDYPTFLEAPESAAANWAAVQGNEEYSNAQIGLSFNRYTQAQGKLSAAVFGSYKDLDELRPFNRLEENTYYMGWRMYWQKNIEFNVHRITFTTGFEMFRENYDWSTFDNDDNYLLSDNKEKRQYENLYAQMEWSVKEKVFISTGINGNLTRFDYTDNYTDNGDNSGKRNYSPVLSPRVGLTYLVDEQLAVFGNISHGFSTPSFEETLLPDGDVNENIKPESGWSFEMGFRSQLLNKVQFSASYYRIYVDNLLVARRTGEDAYVGVNAGQSLHPGLEMEMRWNVSAPGSFPALILFGNATFANYHFTDFVDEEEDFSGKLLPGTAKTIWNAGINLKLNPSILLSLGHRFTGEMPVNDANSNFSDSFGVSNAELSYKGQKGKLKLEIRGGIQNIFDVHYAAMLAVNAPSFGGNLPRFYYPGNPRNYYFSVLLGWINN